MQFNKVLSSVAGVTTYYTFAVSMRATREVTKKWATKLESLENADFQLGMNEWLCIY